MKTKKTRMQRNAPFNNYFYIAPQCFKITSVLSYTGNYYFLFHCYLLRNKKFEALLEKGIHASMSKNKLS